jgi:hypothetical protein
VLATLNRLKAQWLVYVPPGLTFTNSTFCPHSVFMCFVWISEQTAIISLYSINWLDFITETECVYCAVRTGSLNATFCPYSVFMCFVWISEQTAIISLHSINWLVFITETESVYHLVPRLMSAAVPPLLHALTACKGTTLRVLPPNDEVLTTNRPLSFPPTRLLSRSQKPKFACSVLNNNW